MDHPKNADIFLSLNEPVDIGETEYYAAEYEPTHENAVSEQLAQVSRPRSAKATGKSGVHDGHRGRVRDKYLVRRLDGFSEHEIIEMILFYCVSRGDVNPLAHRMLNEFGSFHNLLDASPEEISTRCRVSINTAILFSLFPQVNKRYEASKWSKRDQINSTKKAAAYLSSLFSGKTNEVLYMLCLDSQLKLLYPAIISEGTINEAALYPRLVVQTAIKYNAVYVILSHNHPSGNLIPSHGDFNATQTIVNALSTINVRVLDHLIMCGKAYYSFSEKKLIGFSYDIKNN